MYGEELALFVEVDDMVVAAEAAEAVLFRGEEKSLLSSGSEYIMGPNFQRRRLFFSGDNDSPLNFLFAIVQFFEDSMNMTRN